VDKNQLDELQVDIDKCMHCAACVGSCPQNAIFLREVLIEFNDDCNLCKRCVKTCPVGAISLMEGAR